MLPKNQRLTGNRTDYLLRKGKKTGTALFALKYLPRRPSPSAAWNKSRFCVIVSTKLFPKAVQRNRLRRQIYEILRLRPALPSVPVDLVLIAKPPLTKLDFQDMAKNLTHALQNLTPLS